MLKENLNATYLINLLGRWAFYNALTGIFLLSFLTTSAFATHSNISDIKITLLDSKTKEPIIGANVFTPDASFQTYTDENGQAVLKDLGYRDLVVFSYIGYKNLELAVYEIRRRRGVILLEEDILQLEGIEVVGRRDDPVQEMPYQINRITRKNIEMDNAQTSAELLEKAGNLFVQRSQMGGGSPVIRGFEANRVLLVVDGVRMNNAIYRNGHLQNSITIDPSTLEQVEVIFGPGSLTYGSDALGGVIHYRTKEPKLALEDGEDLVVETNVGTRYTSANQEKMFHVDFNQGGKKWASLSSFSYVDFANLVAGSQRPKDYPDFGFKRFYALNFDPTKKDKAENTNNPNRQWGTEYSQIDILQKVKFQPNENFYLTANFQWSSSSDIPRYDNLQDTLESAKDLKWIEWYYGPQHRIMGSLKARLLNQSFFDKGTIIASFQKIDEDRYDRRWKSNWRSASEVDVFVYALTGDFDKFLDDKERLSVSYGFDISHNDVHSNAYEIYVRGGDLNGKINTVGSDIISRYPSQGSQMNWYGVYGNLKWKDKNERLIAEGGLRYTHTSLIAYFGENDPIAWPQEYIDGIGLKTGALTFAGGLTLNTEDKWHFRGLVASAFRSPNIDDFGKIREKNGFVTIPNSELKPEESTTFEATVSKEIGEIKESARPGKPSYGSSLQVSATAFMTKLNNAIVRQSTPLPDGSLFLEKGGDLLETQANVNASSGDVMGISGNILFKIGDNFELSSNLTYTKGTTRFQTELEGIQIDTLVPFDHIPPLYGKTRLLFKVGKWELSPVVRYNGRKRPDQYSVASARLDANGNVILRRDGTADNLELTPYGFIDKNGNPCNPSEEGGDPGCQEGYAGSLAWTTLNFYGVYQIDDHFSLNFGVENITDLHYRPFASGLSSAGRNIILGIRGTF